MTDPIYKAQAAICRVFTHPCRIEILNLLGKGERSVAELQKAIGMRQPHVSQHLAVLRRCGAVSIRRRHRVVFYRLADARLLEACAIMKSIVRSGRLVSSARGADAPGAGRRRRDRRGAARRGGRSDRRNA